MAAKRKTKAAPQDRATEYARDVVAGRIVAGPYVRKSCARHLSDIERQEALGLVWDREESERVCAFFPACLTLEGGGPFQLMPFQAFIVGSVFGWKTREGTRRFRTAYVEIGKGNGKTPTAGGIAVYALVADGEPAPEVYFAATSQEQASIGWKDAKRMVEASPELLAHVEVLAASLVTKSNNGVLRAVSSEHRGLDGKRVFVALVDELHEHPSGIVVDKMRAGLKARKNGLVFEITNSGDDLETVCYKHHEYSVKVLDGVADDPAWFSYVCALDEGDDWRDESTWLKANPGVDVILPRSYLREQVREAIGMPSKEGIVRRLNFCEWTQQHTVWIPMDKWQALESTSEVPPGWDAVAAGLDLSSKLDLTALVLAFRYPDERPELELTMGKDAEEHRLNVNFRVHLKAFYYRPEDTIAEAKKRDLVDYDVWRDQGWLRVTPGNIVDYNRILDDITDEIDPAYSLRSGQIGFDPYNAAQFSSALTERGFQCVEIPQTVRHLSEPAKLLEALVVDGRITTDGSPVTAWCVSNVAVREDKKGNIFPFKPSERKRIDGVAATIMALSRLITQQSGGGLSVYESRLSRGEELVQCV